MKKSQIFSIIGGSVLLGFLMYRKQKKHQPALTAVPNEPSLKSAVTATARSAKNLAAELKNTLATVNDISTDVTDFMAEVEPQVKELNQSLEKFQK